MAPSATSSAGVSQGWVATAAPGWLRGARRSRFWARHEAGDSTGPLRLAHRPMHGGFSEAACLHQTPCLRSLRGMRRCKELNIQKSRCTASVSRSSPNSRSPRNYRSSRGPHLRVALSDVLAGKSLKIVTDNGPTLSYSFASKNRLPLFEGDGPAFESGYGALTLDKVVFFSHLVPGYAARLPRDRRPRPSSRRCSRSGSAATTTSAKCSARSTTATSSSSRQASADRAPRDHEPYRGQRLPLEAGQRHRDARVLSVGALLELRRAHAARRRALVLRAFGLHQDRRRPLCLLARRVRVLRAR